MWTDYEKSYASAVRDPSFLAWRETGAKQKALNIVRLCQGTSTRSIVEIGCGTGAVLRWLNEMSFAEKFACTDISETALKFAAESCGSFVKEAVVASAESLPFPDRLFDLAILSHVVEHLQNPAAAIEEAARVAEYVFVEVPIEKVFSNIVRTRVFRQPYPSAEGAGHLQFWSDASMRRFLQYECGLEVLKSYRDLLSSEVEFHGKRGVAVVKPALKQVLKAVLPTTMYCNLLTTHAAFLCRRTSVDRAENAIENLDCA